jgi:hypothetical protein
LTPGTRAPASGCPARRAGRSRLGLGAVSLVLALAGCETLIQETEHGRWVDIGPSAEFILNTPVSIPPNRARVFFKNGRISASGANYRTACALEVRGLSGAGAQTISPGRFRITRVQQYWTEVGAQLQDWGVHLQLAALSDGGGQPLIQTGYRFWLARGDEPTVMHLTCLGVLAVPAEAYPPAVDALRGTLGDIASLRLE